MATLESMIDDLRNAKTGFGCWMANDNDGNIDLYCEECTGAENLRSIIRWTGTSIVRLRENREPESLYVGQWDPQRMVDAAFDLGYPVDYDDFEGDENGGYHEAIWNYEEETERRLGITP